MTEEQAIKRIKESRDYQYTHYGFVNSDGVALDMAIEALEKQIPKEPIIVHPLQENDGGAFACPICKVGALVEKIDKFCWGCGQSIKW